MNAFPFRALRVTAACAIPAAALAAPAIVSAQTYRNVVNQRFQTVGNGPQSGIVVDVKDPNDPVGVRRAVQTQAKQALRVRAALAQREIVELRRRHLLKPNQELPLVQVVHLRHNGRLVTNRVSARSNRGLTRNVPGGNDLHINIVTQGQTGFDTGGKSYRAISTFLPTLYPELKKILGAPFSNYTVNINNADPDNPQQNISVRGAIIQVDAANALINIDMPTFTSDQDTFLALAQTLAQCFYAPNNFGYDVWEQGIARAAAVIAAQDLTSVGYFNNLGGGFDLVDPVPGFYYTPFYDLLNQPALGNPTFFPPSLNNQPVAGSLAGMIVPRLQMASTVFTKCYIEDNNFFINFNNRYFDAVSGDGNVANNAARLRDLAAASVMGGNVEGLPFNAWFQQQYIFDTSVTVGPKLFAYSHPSLPDSGSAAGAIIVLIYYNTDRNGDEKSLNGVTNPVYFDYTYTNRLVLSNSNAQEPIQNGVGSISPFFTGIGGGGSNGLDDSKQRLAIDFPVSGSQSNPAQPGGNEYVRVYFPANEESVNNTLTDFSGVFIGAQTGFIQVTFNGGGGALKGGTVGGGGNPVIGAGINGFGFGAFNGTDTGNLIPTGFHKATITFQPNDSATSLTFQRNVFTRKDSTNTLTAPGVSPIFVLNTGLNQTAQAALKHTFQNGPQMISLPVQPYQPYGSNLPALFSLAPGTPDANLQLIAQYRQDADANVGKYLRYPSQAAYQPGYSFWTNFAGVINNLDLSATGVPTDNQDLVSVPLQFGWNMIGNPYSANLALSDSVDTPGIQVQYQNGDALTLQAAIDSGLVAAGVFAYNPASSAYQDITQTTVTGVPQNTLLAWQGYWIRVIATEGVTLSYINPTPAPANGRGVRNANTRTRLAKRTRASHKNQAESGGWRMPLLVRDSVGNASSALLGQSPRGSDGFVPALDAASPPPFAQNVSLSVRFPHADWDTGKDSSKTGQFLSDIRQTGAKTTWNVVVNTPQAEQPYTLTWNSVAKLPRGLRMTLIDLENGTRRLMNTTTSYTFTPGKGVVAHKFQIVAEPRSAGRLLISNFHVDTPLTRGPVSHTIISYELSGAADTSIDILNGTGRHVRRLIAGRAATTGVNQVLWDLKDDQGRAMPTGTYLIQVTARTPEGETARVTLPQPITR